MPVHVATWCYTLEIMRKFANKGISIISAVMTDHEYGDGYARGQPVIHHSINYPTYSHNSMAYALLSEEISSQALRVLCSSTDRFLRTLKTATEHASQGNSCAV